MSSVEGIIISAFIYGLFLMLSLPQMRCRCWPRRCQGWFDRLICHAFDSAGKASNHFYSWCFKDRYEALGSISACVVPFFVIGWIHQPLYSFNFWAFQELHWFGSQPPGFGLLRWMHRGVVGSIFDQVLPVPDAHAIKITWRVRRTLLLPPPVSSLDLSQAAILNTCRILFDLLKSGTKAPVLVQLDEILVPLGWGRAPNWILLWVRPQRAVWMAERCQSKVPQYQPLWHANGIGSLCRCPVHSTPPPGGCWWWGLCWTCVPASWSWSAPAMSWETS